MSAAFIGIYGGTFDPVHLGHVSAARDIQEKLSLDTVQMVLSANPPHRKKPVLSSEDRFKLLTLALNEETGLQADDCEMQRQGPSYMVDTLRYYRQQKPKASLVLILGMEAFNGLQSWHEWENIIGLAHIVVTDRAGFDNVLKPALKEYVTPYLTDDKAQLKKLTHGKICYQPVDSVAVSATDIRQQIAEGKSVQHMLAESCWKMIQQQKFYTPLN
ncbi:MAG: nicotinate-nicotinamide nucleotide adenylyltransferase [Cycloclasticus sp. symbiont of Bathymodiolus heckerae]|nr:MAG: nicotinate-nicotinamide nucleotide adenylyltransferase [Cycloclasticus sp. symbiont of Bathymodiolus heckerae]